MVPNENAWRDKNGKDVDFHPGAPINRPAFNTQNGLVQR